VLLFTIVNYTKPAQGSAYLKRLWHVRHYTSGDDVYGKEEARKACGRRNREE